MVSPLLVHGRLVGAIGIMDADPERYFNRSDLQLLTLFAQQSAIAVENARLYQEARRAAERRTILHRISQEIVTASVYSETSRDQIYTAVHKAASQLMPVEAFAITLLDEEKHEVEAVYLIDKGGRSPTMRIPQGEGLTGRVLALGMSLYIEDVQANSNTAGVHFGSPESVRSILAVPLRFGDRLIGMISAQSYQPHAYTTEDQYLLEMLAANTAIAIQNADLLKKIHWLGITDPLTDLYNRRGFFDLAGREVERFRRFGHPFCALMVDIDNFKQVNDTHGHAIGDQVLIALAKGLELQIRDVDFIGRYGGEEFVIVLPETELPAAIQAAERLREYVENQPITTDRGVLSITVSIGVAKFEENIPELAILIDRADSAMYLAKQSGRNQVKVYQDK
jgi:diguanylate cyclase (GGDEF)-like protein